MTDAITVSPQSDFSSLHFTRSKSGHVHSPFWSYPWKSYNPSGPYAIGSHFHALRAQSVAAFAQALGIRESDVMVTERVSPIDGALEWRCGSKYPVELPKPKTPRLENRPSHKLNAGLPAIDI